MKKLELNIYELRTQYVEFLGSNIEVNYRFDWLMVDSHGFIVGMEDDRAPFHNGSDWFDSNEDKINNIVGIVSNRREVDFDWTNYERLRNNQIYSGNILSDVEYPENKVEEFFENNKKIFQTLSNAHIKKINSY